MNKFKYGGEPFIAESILDCLGFLLEYEGNVPLVSSTYNGEIDLSCNNENRTIRFFRNNEVWLFQKNLVLFVQQQ